MRKIKAFFFSLCLCSPLQADDSLASAIRLLPWDSSSVVSAAQDETPDFTIAISYEKPGIISDTDTYGLRLKPREKNVFHSLTCTYTARDSFGTSGKWCNGGSYLGKVTQDALSVTLSLSWGDRHGNNGRFKETFALPWKQRQIIERDGFKIVVSVTAGRATGSE